MTRNLTVHIFTIYWLFNWIISVLNYKTVGLKMSVSQTCMWFPNNALRTIENTFLYFLVGTFSVIFVQFFSSISPAIAATVLIGDFSNNLTPVSHSLIFQFNIASLNTHLFATHSFSSLTPLSYKNHSFPFQCHTPTCHPLSCALGTNHSISLLHH